jgi:hypothetical protein
MFATSFATLLDGFISGNSDCSSSLRKDILVLKLLVVMFILFSLLRGNNYGSSILICLGLDWRSLTAYEKLIGSSDLLVV